MILVTGATGLIGSFITHELIQQGYKVRILTRSSNNLTLIQDIVSELEIIEGDILDVYTLQKAFENIDSVIHTAALVSFNPKDSKQLMKTNVEGTANMVNLSLDFNIKKFIHIRSIAAIGSTSTNSNLDETSKWNPDEPHSNYAFSKHKSELEVWRGIEEGLPATIINPSVVLGPASYQKSSAKIFAQAIEKGIFTINSFVNVVDVRDVTTSVIKLLTSNIIGERFILNAGIISYTDLISEIRKHNGLNKPKYTVPLWLIKIYAKVRQLISAITFKPSEITTDSIRSLTKPTHYNGAKITHSVNMEYKPILETLAWCCKNIVDKKQ